MSAAALDAVRVHTRCRVRSKLAESRLLASIKVDIFEVEGVNVSRDEAEERQADIDNKVSPESCNHEDADGRYCRLLAEYRDDRGRGLRRMVMRTTRRAGMGSDILTLR